MKTNTILPPGVSPNWRITLRAEIFADLRLDDVEPETTGPRNTVSCQGRSLCFSAYDDDDMQIGPDYVHSEHKCQRHYQSVVRRDNPVYHSVLGIMLDIELWVKVFSCIMLIFIVCCVCFQKECGFAQPKKK